MKNLYFFLHICQIQFYLHKSLNNQFNSNYQHTIPFGNNSTISMHFNNEFQLAPVKTSDSSSENSRGILWQIIKKSDLQEI